MSLPSPEAASRKGVWPPRAQSDTRTWFGKFHVKFCHPQKIKSLENYTRAAIAIANSHQTILPPCNESSQGQGEMISKRGLKKIKERESIKQGAGKNGCLSSSPFVLGVTSLIFSYTWVVFNFQEVFSDILKVCQIIIKPIFYLLIKMVQYLPRAIHTTGIDLKSGRMGICF